MDKIKDLAEEYFIENLVADEGGHLAKFGEIAYKAGVADTLTATGSMESAYRTHESRATDERDLAYRMYREGVADTEARLAVAVEALKDLIVVAGNIRHWHDWGRDDEGMIVSSESVRNLWTQTSKTQEALTKIGAKNDE